LLYLLIAAIFEAAWTFCLKFLSFKDIKNLPFSHYFTLEGFQVLSPLLGYILFGVGNIYFFALGMKQVPTATAMAVWTATTLILIKIAELYLFDGKLNWSEAFFLLLITIGIIGLKVVASE